MTRWYLHIYRDAFPRTQSSESFLITPYIRIVARIISCRIEYQFREEADWISPGKKITCYLTYLLTDEKKERNKNIASLNSFLAFLNII